MDQQHFIMPGMNFQSFGDENMNPNNMIKNEEVKDEDMLLFSTADLENLGANNAFQIIQDLEVANNQTIPQFPLQQAFGEVPTQINNGQDGAFLNRLPIDLSGLCKLEGIKNEASVSHFVKYKFQDGKHIKVWECGICGKEFGHQYTLMRHLPTHTDERKFQCNTCGKAFRQMSTLSQHRAIHSSERPYVCEVCHKTFNRVSTLISHRKTHTGLKPHRCHLCNKAFHQKGNLRNHIFTHTNERPYKCDICNKGFNQMSNLMCHKVKAHQRAEKPKYICQICHKDFPKRISLRNHEQYQHGLNNQPLDMSIHSDNLKDANAIIVEPIKTEAMRLALEANQIPFALLRPLTGIPVLVRVLPAGDKQMLVPATAEDLKKHGHISITPKETNESTLVATGASVTDKPTGSTVQIRIPVVATVIQQSCQGGRFSMSVVSPGPNPHDAVGNTSGSENFVFTSTMNTENLLDINDLNNPVSAASHLTPNSSVEFVEQVPTVTPFQNELGLSAQTENMPKNDLNIDSDVNLYKRLIEAQNASNSANENCSNNNNSNLENAMQMPESTDIQFLMI